MNEYKVTVIVEDTFESQAMECFVEANSLEEALRNIKADICGW